MPLDVAWDRIGHDLAIQGNLDPAALLAPGEAIDGEVRAVLARAAGRDGHVFNLGHGVLPMTPVEALQRVVDVVHTESEHADELAAAERAHTAPATAVSAVTTLTTATTAATVTSTSDEGTPT